MVFEFSCFFTILSSLLTRPCHCNKDFLLHPLLRLPQGTLINVAYFIIPCAISSYSAERESRRPPPHYYHLHLHGGDRRQISPVVWTLRRPATVVHTNRKYPDNYLPIPKQTFKNLDRQSARRKPEVKKAKMSGEELTDMVRRSTREHASAAKALRARIAANKAKRAQLFTSKDNKIKNDDNGDDEDTAATATSPPGDCTGWQPTCTIPFVKMEQQTLYILWTSPDGGIEYI